MRRGDLGLGAAATVALGVPFLLIEVAQRSFPTTTMAALRVLLAAVTLGALLLASQRARTDVLRLVTTRPVAAAAVALHAALLPNLLIGVGERHVPTGPTAILLCLTPVWIAIASALLANGDPVDLRHGGALVAAAIGVTLVCGASAPTEAWGWYLLPLAASASYAVASLVVRHRLSDFHPLAVTAVEMTLAAVPLLAAVALMPGPAVTVDETFPLAVVALVLAGVGCSGLGWLANTALAQRVGAVRSSVVSYTAVVLSVVLGVVVLGEPLTPQTVTGSVVLVVSVWVFLSPRRMKERKVLELSILGFLSEEPLHAYELRKRISSLNGHAQPVSDGALTPALRRMERAGLLRASREPGSSGPPRKVFHLTDAGEDELLRRLTDPNDVDITNSSRYFTLLAFLDRLPDPELQRAVLQRRLDFLEAPGRGFFTPGAPGSRFRTGMNEMARGISMVERRWLRAAIDDLSPASSPSQ